MKPPVDKRQKDAARFVGPFVPTPRSRPWLRRLTIQLFFSAAFLKFGLGLFGTKSALAGRGRD